MIVLEQLFNDLPIPALQLRALMLTAPNRYKFFYIAKRNGGRRLISQPAKEVKLLQRLVVEHLRKSLPIHRAATAYEPNTSIRVNAELHAKNRFLLKIDFKNFFPSIRDVDVSRFLRKTYPEMSDEELKLLVKLLVLYDPSEDNYSLAAGAPSSPFISNAIMYEFDTQLAAFCASCDVTYSRYADDLALSTNAPNLLVEVHKYIDDLVTRLEYPSLKINQDKTLYTSKKRGRKVTGLTLTSQNQVSIGREAKRQLRAAVDRFRKSELSAEAVSHLRGRLSYAIAVEPEFVDRLRAHYGDDVISRLFRSET